MSIRGYYKIKDLKKYKGDPTKCIYRSLWERKFMIYCDNNPSIIQWASEELAIPYYSQVDKKMHKYYIDFWIKVKQKDNVIKHFLIEIKPEKQTKKPERKSKREKRYLNEMVQWETNTAKWNAAQEFCNKNNIEFLILTEKQLFQK